MANIYVGPTHIVRGLRIALSEVQASVLAKSVHLKHFLAF